MKLLQASLVGIIVHFTALQAYDSGHFWRARPFWREPHVLVPGTRSLQASVAQGDTSTSRNSCGERGPLFDLYGHQTVQFLGAGVPGLSDNAFDIVLKRLVTSPVYKDPAAFVFCGRFEIVEAYFDAFQSFNNGFFANLTIPVRSFQVHRLNAGNVCFPQDQIYNDFLRSFYGILAQYDITIKPYSYTALGDTTLSVGWAYSWDVPCVLDFVDTMIVVGGLLPTGRVTPLSRPFEIPTGYDGHFGISTSVDCALGIFDWITLGIHAENLAFFDRTRFVRLKTDCRQNGFIKLATDCARVHQGPLWAFGLYFKADHVVQGLSILFAYCYEHQQKSTYTPCSQAFDYAIVNSDSALAGFTQQLFNLVLEYDFTRAYGCYGPSVGLFYNHSIAGKRIFITPMVGAYAGINIRWDF